MKEEGTNQRIMDTISIIGLGNMARALASRALEGGNAVEIIGRNPAKAKTLADVLGATVGTAPTGDIVILAVPYANAAAVLRQHADALRAKVIVDITNPHQS
ncbi:MAG: NAD(P)-binding domain-containing protein [Mycobacterium sp.]